MDLTLHSVQDDFKLNALADTPRSAGRAFVFLYYLTDELGNHLTDESGNLLVARYDETLYPQTLNSIQDDFKLNAE